MPSVTYLIKFQKPKQTTKDVKISKSKTHTITMCQACNGFFPKKKESFKHLVL
jgi:hypothetical protein